MKDTLEVSLLDGERFNQVAQVFFFFFNLKCVSSWKFNFHSGEVIKTGTFTAVTPTFCQVITSVYRSITNNLHIMVNNLREKVKSMHNGYNCLVTCDFTPGDQ